MARISLLFSLALVIAIGSVSAHPPFHRRFEKSVSLSQVQSYTSNTVSKIVQKQAHQSIQQTVQFKILFNVCKGYTEYLKTFKNYSGAKNAVALVKAKYTVMSSMMRVAQATIGVEGSLKVMLSASYDSMSNNFNEIAEKLALISTKYKFNAIAKISQSDLADIDDCLVRLKGSIRIYFKVITDVSKKCSAAGDFDFRARIGSGFLASFAKQGLGFGGQAGANVGGLLGAHASELGPVAEGQIEGKAGVNFGGKIGANAGAKVGAKAGAQASAKAGAKVGAKAGAQASAKAGAKAGVQAGFKVGGEVGAKAGAQASAKAGAEVKVEAHAEAKAGGHAGRFLGGYGYGFPPRSSKSREGTGKGVRLQPIEHFRGEIGAKVGAQAGAEAKVGADAGAKAGGDAGRILRGVQYGLEVLPHQSKLKVDPRPIEHLRGEIGAKVGAQAGAEAKVGGDAGAKAGGDAGRILRGLEYGFGFPPPRPSFEEDKPRVGRAGEYFPLPTRQFSGKIGAEAGAQAGAEPKEDKPSQ